METVSRVISWTAKLAEYCAESDFLSVMAARSEKLFAPIGKVTEKDGCRVKPILETGERLVALNGYENGAVLQTHSRIFPIPAYFLQGIRGALPIVYVREGVARALLDYLELLPKGYGIRVYDGFRPIVVQQAIFDSFYAVEKDKPENAGLREEELIKEVKKYVSVPSLDPYCPSTHNTGGSIDFRICTSCGKELDYGCEFDDFRPVASLDYFENRLKNSEELPENAVRAMLTKRVTANLAKMVGLCLYRHEDWHYDRGNQWDLGCVTARYGSCESSGVQANQEYGLAELITGDSVLLGRHKQYLC